MVGNFRPRYYTQLDEAIRDARHRRVQTPGLRIWGHDIERYSAKENKHVLKKDYCVMTTQQMYAFTYAMQPHERVFYEILTDPKDYPQEDDSCLLTRIYVDAEYEREDNPDYAISDEDLTKLIRESLIEAVARELHNVTVEDNKEMYSGSTSKYSVHMTCQLKKGSDETDTQLECFLSNPYHVGAFYRKWELWERTHQVRPELFVQKFYKGKKDPVIIFVVDNSVYNKHRQFRLPAHTKFKANRFLKFNGSAEIPWDIWSRLLAQDHVRTDANTPRIICLERDGTEPYSRNLIYDKTTNSNKRLTDDARLADSTRPKQRMREQYDDTSITVRGGSTTLVDACVAWVRSTTNDHGASAYSGPVSSIITVSAPNTTRCGLIGQEHRNKVYFQFDIEKMAIFQKCHSTKCDALRKRKIIVDGKEKWDPTRPRTPAYPFPCTLMKQVEMAKMYRDAVAQFVSLPQT